jgi:hypothetical protein
MAGPKTPRELADRMRDHRAQHRAFTQPRDDARQTVREFLDRYPKPAYMSEVEHWREQPGGEIEFTMKRPVEIAAAAAALSLIAWSAVMPAFAPPPRAPGIAEARWRFCVRRGVGDREGR